MLAADRMRAICDGFPIGHEVQIKLDLRNVFDVLINNPDLSDAYLAAAADIAGIASIIERDEPATRSEDFADMLKVGMGA